MSTDRCSEPIRSERRMTEIGSHRSLSFTFVWGYEFPRPSTPSLRSSARPSPFVPMMCNACGKTIWWGWHPED